MGLRTHKEMVTQVVWYWAPVPKNKITNSCGSGAVRTRHGDTNKVLQTAKQEHAGRNITTNHKHTMQLRCRSCYRLTIEKCHFKRKEHKCHRAQLDGAVFKHPRCCACSHCVKNNHAMVPACCKQGCDFTAPKRTATQNTQLCACACVIGAMPTHVARARCRSPCKLAAKRRETLGGTRGPGLPESCARAGCC